MGKYCCVNGCESGRVPDRRNRDKKKVRQVSLFQIPQCNELKEKWEKALSQKLNVNQFVCGNHFHEKDILKAHRFVINGIESIYPRSKWSLVNKNVIPVEKKPLVKDIPKKLKNKIRKLHHRQHSTELSEGNNVKAGLQLKQEFKHIEPSPEIEKLQESHLADVLGVDDAKAGLQLKQEFNHIETASNNENSLTVEDHHQQSSLAVTVVSDETAGLQLKQELDHIGVFTLGDIKTYFSSVLMEGWCYFATDAEFIFIHVNLLTRQEDKRFSIDKNLSVKVSFSQRPEYSEDVIISSIEDIKTYIEYLSRTVLCKGVGMPDSEFSTSCIGKISSDKYKRWQQTPRCSECRKLRQGLQIRENHKKTRKQNPGTRQTC